MTSGAAGDAEFIGYEQNDLTYGLLHKPLCSLDGRGLDYIASKNILPPKITDILQAIAINLRQTLTSNLS
jgi:hypothetical protein